MGQSCTKEVSTRETYNATNGGVDSRCDYRRPSHDDDEHATLALSPNNFSDEKVLNHLSSSKKSRITRVVLTGGPCAGKSTALADLQRRVPQKFGLQVYCVPEAATLMVNGGLQWSDDPETTISYQLTLLKVQLTLEDSFFQIAKASKKPSLILCDRGTMDGRVYCSDTQFNELLKRGGYTLEKLRDERYDAVIHMVTAATGAEEFYNFDNPARMENVSEAKVNDDRLRDMYIGHPKIRVIDNSTDFEKKLDRVLDFVGEVTGSQQHSHRTKRYFVKGPIDLNNFPVAFTRVQLTITILNNSTREETLLVIKRQQGDAVLYFYQALRRVEGLPSSRHEHKISAREYLNLMAQRDSSRVDVVKENIAFMYETLYCELGIFEQPHWVEGVALMYVEPTGSADDEGYTPQLRPSGVRGSPNKFSSNLDSTVAGITNLDSSLMSVSADSQSATSPNASVNGSSGRRLRASIELPPFLQIEKDISDDKYLSSFYVSHKETGPDHARIALEAVRTTLTCDAFALEESTNGNTDNGETPSVTKSESRDQPVRKTYVSVAPTKRDEASQSAHPLANVPEPFATPRDSEDGVSVNATD